MKYFDWRIDSSKTFDSLLWLREYDDGTIKVVFETDGKVDDAANVLFKIHMEVAQ